ncbi:hypothetical protein NECAME_00721 [Necator americanus]|uniref:Uncharacterized protein n=1 Tax=Necator americanus TaxID=51031 RepID=W2SV64_NECAM|nr:hypothetical protein NECAME_00721 [Necator americanus]ETN73634.1 hypothetical protein NECAME_00721 [Necator americanus]
MEDIERAKDLIIETIKRNMSPIRPDQAVHELPEEEDDENDNDISIETTQDGMLKLCCSDPQVLQAAQEALSEYLRARARPSAEEREKRKERRKSMPLQASHPETPSKPIRSFHGSTPNLAEAGSEAAQKKTTPANKGSRTMRYDRDSLLDMRSKAGNVDVEEVRARVTAVAPEILR